MSVRRDEVLRRALANWPESHDEDRLMLAAKTMARNDVSDKMLFSAPSPRAIVARTKENSPTWARQYAEAIAIQPMQSRLPGHGFCLRFAWLLAAFTVWAIA
jgi:hypothetical protein